MIAKVKDHYIEPLGIKEREVLQCTIDIHGNAMDENHKVLGRGGIDAAVQQITVRRGDSEFVMGEGLQISLREITLSADLLFGGFVGAGFGIEDPVHITDADIDQDQNQRSQKTQEDVKPVIHEKYLHSWIIFLLYGINHEISVNESVEMMLNCKKYINNS
jgi:hypothetical protein